MTANRLLWVLPVLAALVLGSAASAQHDHSDRGGKKQTEVKATAHIGGAYPFSTCPVSGKKLGSMGDPVVKLYEGREVRYCCGGCVGKFEKDLAASLSALDAKIVADQAPLYPLNTSVVTEKKLPEKTCDFVYRNRMIRVADEKEKAEFAKDPAKFVKVLDAAVVAMQGKDYPLKVCPVTDDPYQPNETVDVILGGRLVRIGCENCLDQVEKDPARLIEILDASRRKAADAKSGEGKPDKSKEKK